MGRSSGHTKEEFVMPRFIILPREEPSTFMDLSPDEVQAIIMRYLEWAAPLEAEGTIEYGHKLVDGTGKVLRPDGAGVSVTDGPYAELKEVVGGFWIGAAADLDQMAEKVSGCPHLEYGSLEIRQLEEMEG